MPFKPFQRRLPETTIWRTVAPSSGVDTLIMLYSPSFDPSNPTTNLITCDDDGGSAWPLSKITANLGAGVQYQVMVTTWNATIVDGTINWRILPDIVLIIATAVCCCPDSFRMGYDNDVSCFGNGCVLHIAQKTFRVPQPSSCIFGNDYFRDTAFIPRKRRFSGGFPYSDPTALQGQFNATARRISMKSM